MKREGPSKRRQQAPHVTECLKIAIEMEVNRFLESEEIEFTFPSTLTNQDRAYIHELVKNKGLISKSHGKATRALTLYKPQKKLGVRKQKCVLKIADATEDAIYTLLEALPVNVQQQEQLKMRSNRNLINRTQFNVGTLTQGYVIPPPQSQGNHVRNFRKQLPIYQMRSEILGKVHDNQVIVIVSETGSGKTTQVPQYLLENATKYNQPCRIICTQPRRLAALSVADRVSFERGEQLGDCVGYQIRLESKTSPTSNLIYCTNGILVRCLMGGHYEKVFANITHVIVDEVHERDKHSDFLLISLKEALAVNPRLKIILMSATIDAQVFSTYFNNSPVISIPGRLFDVTNYYLEHVLMMTEYCNGQMEKIVESKKIKKALEHTEGSSKGKIEAHIPEPLDEETIKLINETLELCWTQCDDDSFQQFLYLVAGENVPIDFRHTETDMTALMIAAGRGMDEFVDILLQMGANVNVTSQHGMKALDWAKRFNQDACIGLLEFAGRDLCTESDQQEKRLTDEYTEILLDAYQSSLSTFEEEIDHKLLFTLIRMIHTQNALGSILVFLTGYEAILRQNEMIQDAIARGNMSSNVKIYMLHSNMKIHDQKSVFEPAPSGCRKIILSTNITETSITIDDVVYVIDCGKVKQTIFDAVGGTTSLETTWISQACAKQRAGRAGRVTQGVCFRLYSLARFAIMDKFTIPELLRVPLTEICLSAKLIAPQTAIADFLQKALQPPPTISVRRSVELLKTMGALDNEENITDLGMHLADLPIDAHLGKMVIFSILLKCVDPVLTIVSTLSVRDPFILPTGAKDREREIRVKEELAEKSFSDHMIFIRIFQKWLNSSGGVNLRQFCEENFVSSGAMQTICGVRSQILGHLRANGLIKSKGRGNIHDLNQNSKHWAVVKACLVSGLYPNVTKRDLKNGCIFRGEVQEKLMPHPQSILGSKRNIDCKAKIRTFPTDWVVFEEKVRVGRSAYIRCNSVVTPATVALFAGPIDITEEKNLVPVAPIESDSDVESPDAVIENEIEFHVDDNIQFNLTDVGAYLLFHLRQKLNNLLLTLIQNPDSFHLSTNGPEGQVINTLVQVLLAEEKQNQLPIPEGIGERPQAVSLDFSADVNYGISDESRTLKQTHWNINDAMQKMKIDNRRSDKRGGHKRNQKTDHKMETRYFLIKAATTQQVKHILSGNDWCFSTNTFFYLQRCMKKFPNVDIMLIFHVSAAQMFYGMGQLIHRRGQYSVAKVHDGTTSFKTVRDLIKRQKAASFTWNDGEELSNDVGELFRQLLNTKDKTAHGTQPVQS
ncbi:RNA helicase [Sergentomyia squamirostris]